MEENMRNGLFFVVTCILIIYIPQSPRTFFVFVTQGGKYSLCHAPMIVLIIYMWNVMENEQIFSPPPPPPPPRKFFHYRDVEWQNLSFILKD